MPDRVGVAEPELADPTDRGMMVGLEDDFHVLKRQAELPQPTDTLPK